MINNNDVKSLAHTKWNCKYHIVFAPKFRRKVFYESKRLENKGLMLYKSPSLLETLTTHARSLPKEIGKMIRDLCKWKEINLIEGEVCIDHVHILVEIPPKISVSSFMGFLKGKTSIMIYQKYGNMKFKYRNRNFWCRGYYVDTAGKDAKKIQKYIQDQLKEDELSEQLTLDLSDPFMGSK